MLIFFLHLLAERPLFGVSPIAVRTVSARPSVKFEHCAKTVRAEVMKLGKGKDTPAIVVRISDDGRNQWATAASDTSVAVSQQRPGVTGLRLVSS